MWPSQLLHAGTPQCETTQIGSESCPLAEARFTSTALRAQAQRAERMPSSPGAPEPLTRPDKSTPVPAGAGTASGRRNSAWKCRSTVCIPQPLPPKGETFTIPAGTRQYITYQKTDEAAPRPTHSLYA